MKLALACSLLAAKVNMIVRGMRHHFSCALVMFLRRAPTLLLVMSTRSPKLAHSWKPIQRKVRTPWVLRNGVVSMEVSGRRSFMCKTYQGGPENDQSDRGLVQLEWAESFLSALRGTEAYDEEDEPGGEEESLETIEEAVLTIPASSLVITRWRW